jgi:hypothetical protein
MQKGIVFIFANYLDDVLVWNYVLERHETQFFQWSLYMAHHSAVIEYGDHSKMEILLEIDIICQSSKAAKNWLIRTGSGAVRCFFTSWLYYGLI